MKDRKPKIAFFAVLFATLSLSSNLIFPSAASALSKEEWADLNMYFKPEELVVQSATRSPKDITKVAENITVITKDEIEMMNAHTLADVLNTIPGVQVFMTGGPGSQAPVQIQGSEQRHVVILIDGVSMGIIGSNVAENGAVPVQNIEKIEIIKGPASSAWGSSLGGVINVITKSGRDDKGIGGTVSASYGERNTGDYRAEISGRNGDVGYYLNAGNLRTDGFRSHNDFYANNFYGKLLYDITTDTKVLFTLGYNKGSRGIGEYSAYGLMFDDKVETLFSTLSLNTVLDNDVRLNFALRGSRLVDDQFTKMSGTGTEVQKALDKDEGYGASAKMTWEKGSHNIVVGADYDDRTFKSNTITDGEQGQRKWAFFANDTISFEKFSITPGLRYDSTDTNNNFISPSLGITYNLSNKTLLRAYIARGFSTPPLLYTYGDSLLFQPNPGLKMENVWSYQVGAETTSLKYLWLKVSAFRNDIKDAITYESVTPTSFTYVNSGSQRRQGFEMELKTVPVYHTLLFAGAAFIDTKDPDTDKEVKNVPRYTYDAGLQYDDQKSFKALLKGHYIWWNAEASTDGKYNSFVVDINLIKKIYVCDGNKLEAFVTAHNIFNGSQYVIDVYSNPQRWIEGGLRYRF